MPEPIVTLNEESLRGDLRELVRQTVEDVFVKTVVSWGGVVPLFRTSSPRPPAPGSVGIVAGSSSRATV